MSHVAEITHVFAMCALKALIQLAGGKLPPGVKLVPNPELLDSATCVKLVDVYSSYLRSIGSLKETK